MSPTAVVVFLLNLFAVLTVVFYGVIAVWAVFSPWHWFWRLTILLGACSALLIIDAPELAIQYSAATTSFTFGLSIWNRWRLWREANSLGNTVANFWPRISLGDLMLSFLIIAIVLAVAVNLREVSIYKLLFTLVDGAAIAVFGLACAWVALGRARLAVRLAISPLLILIICAVYCIWIDYVGDAILLKFDSQNAVAANRSLAEIWTRFINYHKNHLKVFSLEIEIGFHWLLPTTLGFVAFSTWLALGRSAGWIEWPRRSGIAAVLPASPAVPSRRPTSWHWAAVAHTTVLAAIPCLLFARLAIRRPFTPTDTGPGSRYQEVVSIGSKLEARALSAPHYSSKITDVEHRKLLARDKVEIARFRELLAEGFVLPWRTSEYWEGSREVHSLGAPLWYIFERGDETGSVQSKVEACLEQLRLMEIAHKTMGLISYPFPTDAANIVQQTWQTFSELSAAQFHQLALAWHAYDQRREPWEVVAMRQRLVDDHEPWDERLQQIARRVVGDSKPDLRSHYEFQLTTPARLLIVELAVRAFELKNGRLPESLSELVPSIIPSLPADPHGNGTFQYRKTEQGYLVYSLGSNGRDDGGITTKGPPGETPDDVTLSNIYSRTTHPPSANAQPVATPEVKSNAPNNSSATK